MNQPQDTDDIFSGVKQLLSEEESATRKRIKQARLALLDAAQLIFQGTEKDRGYPKHMDTEQMSMLLNLSDSHFGKEIHDMNTNSPVVKFNIPEATRKQADFFSYAFHEYEMNKDTIDEININLIGDHIEGDGSIFPAQVFEIIDSATGQVVSFVESFYSNLINLAKIAPIPINIYAIPGNHGEMRRGYIKNPSDNWDTLIFKFIDYMLRRDKANGNLKNVSITYPHPDMKDKKHIRYKTKGWIVHLEHIMPPNLTTPSGQHKIQNVVLNYDEKADIILTGHYHSESLATIGRTTVVRVSSLGGFDQFANDIKASFSEAGQSIIMVSPSQKVKYYMPICLEKR